MDKGPEAGSGKAPWKDHSDRSSEGRGWHEVRLDALEARLGERSWGAQKPCCNFLGLYF